MHTHTGGGRSHARTGSSNHGEHLWVDQVHGHRLQPHVSRHNKKRAEGGDWCHRESKGKGEGRVGRRACEYVLPVCLGRCQQRSLIQTRCHDPPSPIYAKAHTLDAGGRAAREQAALLGPYRVYRTRRALLPSILLLQSITYQKTHFSPPTCHTNTAPTSTTSNKPPPLPARA